jgi:hypothetical protein
MMEDLNLKLGLTKLLKISIAQYLKLSDGVPYSLNPNEVRSLLGYASILSLSDDADEISKAYEICSRLVETANSDYPFVTPATDIILSRIGNFPGRALLREKFLNNQEPSIALPLLLERLARESENSIGDANLLTDFQYKLYSTLASERSLSVSAPTSAGKSHVLSLDLVRRLQAPGPSCIVYIVPTRALVSEVVFRIRSAIRDNRIDEAIVRTAPFPINELGSSLKVVYVLTQERLLRLLTFDISKITALIIDEAHELQKGKRGILLQNAIDIALKKHPSTSIFFASPLISNPGYFLNVFKRTDQGTFFTEQISPVSQNIISISEVPRKPELVKVDLIRGTEVLPIGQSAINFKFRGSKVIQKAHFALQITGIDESTIIFSDDASDAEECAAEISRARIENQRLNEDEIKDFIAFIRSEVHPEYPLIETLERGVAFHYGNMPSIVRNGVERLVKKGTIKFLCSTSTLLQGVNLPAKHIIILNPHLGSDQMERSDFRNLAGRAGRLLKEFHGNVWCLRPGDWESDCYQGENLQEIKGAMDRLMVDGGSMIGAVLDGIDLKEEKDLADAAYSRLYHEVVEKGEEGVFLTYSSPQNEDSLRANIEHLAALKLDVPDEILASHRSLRPDMLQILLDNLRNLTYLENAILISPFLSGGKERMQYALSLINQSFDVKMEDRYFNWVSGTAHNWVWGKPIGEILGEYISFVRKKNADEKASPLIRKILKLIETEIRYKLVKYFAAYEDLLRHVLDERGKNELTVAPYHVYLEFGAADHITLSLMAVGLSRFTAIKLRRIISWGDETEPEHFVARIVEIGIANLPLPRLCKQELYDLLGEK